MIISEKLSPKALQGSALDAIKRFPIAFAFSILIMCICIYMVHFNHCNTDCLAKILYYLGTGFVLSASLRLISERLDGAIKPLLVRIVPLALWGGACWLLFYLIDDSSTKNIYLPLFFAMTSAVLVFFFTCLFLSRDSDLQFWKFGANAIRALVLGAFVSSALLGGIALFFQILRLLFDIVVGDKLYGDLAIVAYTGILPLLFLSLIDSRADIAAPLREGLSKMAGRIVHFLLLGLLGLYMLSLYVYGLKILFTLELPRGWVSVLVSICMAGMMIVLMCVYPDKELKSSRLDERLFRLLPALMLPLVLLMSVGIVKRFCDYGITMPRLWLLLVNLWYWAICLYLLLSAQKRIVWIPVSFAAIFLFFSVGPWSVASITRAVLCSQVRSLADKGGVKLPLCQGDGRLEDSGLSSKLEYLLANYSREDLQGLVDSVWTPYFDSQLGGQDLEPSKDYSQWLHVNSVELDHSVRMFKVVESASARLLHDKNADSVYHVMLDIDDSIYEYDVPKSLLEGEDSEVMTWRSDNSLLAVKYYSLTQYPESRDDSDLLEVEGYLFAW